MRLAALALAAWGMFSVLHIGYDILGRSTQVTSIATIDMPNHRLTPGSVVSMDRSLICSPGYAKRVRHPYDYAWRQLRVRMFEGYGIPHDHWHEFTVDHLVPIEVGGDPFNLQNIWPQPKAQAIEKDRYENLAHEEVCAGRITLEAAQHAFETDWRSLP